MVLVLFAYTLLIKGSNHSLIYIKILLEVPYLARRWSSCHIMWRLFTSHKSGITVVYSWKTQSLFVFVKSDCFIFCWWIPQEVEGFHVNLTGCIYKEVRYDIRTDCPSNFWYATFHYSQFFNIFLNYVLKDQMQTCFFLPLLRFVIIYFCVRSFCHDPEILLEKTQLLLFSL